MVRLRACFLAIGVGAALLLANGLALAAGKPPSGRSAELGIDFDVDGGASWCAYGVKVTLNAQDPRPLVDNSQSFQQMLGRIRAIIQTDCPKTRAIGFFGKVGREEVSSGESAQATDWVYVPFDRKGQMAYCVGPDDPYVCSRRWEAFRKARDLFRNPRFEGLRFTRFLNTSDGPSGADLVWRSGEMVGRLTYADRKDGRLPYETAAEVVNLQVKALAQSCEGSASRQEVREISAASAAYGGVRCSKDGRDKDYRLLVSGRSGVFSVIAFSSFSPDGHVDPGFEAKLLDAVEGRPFVQPPGPTFDLTVCNESRYSIETAFYRRYAPDSDDFLVLGWLKVPSEDCRTVPGVPKGEFGYFGIGDKGRREWSNKDSEKKKLCVEPDAFKRLDADSHRCKKSRVKPFSVFEVSTDDFTLTLN